MLKIESFVNSPFVYIKFQNVAISVTAEIVASAWRELSEKYRRRLYDGKRRNGATNWPYFQAMSFLQEQYE